MKHRLAPWLRDRKRGVICRRHSNGLHFIRPRLECLEDRQLLSGGPLDPTFGNGGIVLGLTNPPIRQVASYAALQPDGKIVVAVDFQNVSAGSWKNNIEVERYNTDGSVDSTFGQGGTISLNIPGYQTFSGDALAIQADGKILVFGEAETFIASSPPISASVLVRLNSNGDLDTSFAGTGYASSPLDLNKCGDPAGQSQVVVQPDGKIIVGGSAGLVRFNVDGSPDAKFGPGGMGFTADNFSEFTAVALQGNGTIIVTAETGPVGVPGALVAGQSAPNYPSSTGQVSIFSGDGLLENSFVAFGPTNVQNQVPYPTISVLSGLEVQGDGRIVAVGDNGTQAILTRFNPDGTPDPSFGTNGIVDTGISSRDPVDITVAPNGDFLVATTDVSERQIVLAAFTPDGSADLQFGSGGQTRIDFGSAAVASWVNNIFVQPDGNIVVDAVVLVSEPGYVVGLARLLGDGVIDTPPPSLPTGPPPVVSSPPPTTVPNPGPAPAPIFIAGGASAGAALALTFTANRLGNTSALALALGSTTLAPLTGLAASKSIVLPQGSQVAVVGTDLPGATTGLHSLDLTYFGSGGGSDKERGDAGNNAIQDASFASLTDEV